jgi:hypothetical protein
LISPVLFRNTSIAGLLRLLLLLLSFPNAIILGLDHGVELGLLIVAGERGANLINGRLPELVDLLQFRVMRK